MRILISLFGGITIFSVMGWFAIGLPGIPYNIHKMFATQYPFLTLLVFSGVLYWCFGYPVYLASWLSRGNWLKILLFPLQVVFHGIITYSLLRISVPMESIHKIVGSPILNWPWEWELLGRFIALFGIFSLFLTGGALVSLLQCYDYFYKWNLMWRWIIMIIVLLPLGYWVVIRQADTDNLTELMRGGGNWISVLSLSSWIFILGCCASTLLFQAIKCRRYSFVSAVIFGLLSLPVGFLALQLGTENVIYKYGDSFSALQFLLSPNRSNLVGPEDLIFRYTIFHILIVGIIAITQYPFSRLFVFHYSNLTEV